MTLAPSAAKRSDVALPIPEPAPVTSATLPSSRSIASPWPRWRRPIVGSREPAPRGAYDGGHPKPRGYGVADLNGGQIIARQLRAAGIDTAFGVVAGPMIEVMAAMEREGITVVNCRHEVSAGFAASAWGWARGKPGVLVVGSGPALTNAVTPMYVATESAMPLVVLGGSSAGNQRGLGAFQEADQVAFAAPRLQVGDAGR